MSKFYLYFCKFCNRIVRNTRWYNESFWGGATKFWNERQFGLDVVNVGSGAAVHAFSYEGINIKGRNWALGPQSLVHDFNIIRNYFSFIKEGGVVFIPICPFSCLCSIYDKRHNFKYYTFLHPATIIDFDEKERTRAIKVKINPFREMPFYCIKRTVMEPFIKLKHIFLPAKKDFQSSADLLINGWKNQFSIQDLNKPLNDRHKTEFLNRKNTLNNMVEFLKERSLIPVIVVMPMHHALSSQLSNEFKHNYIDAFVDGLKCEVMDFFYDKEFDNDDYYSTALFFNGKGAAIFTKKIISKLESLKERIQAN